MIYSIKIRIFHYSCKFSEAFFTFIKTFRDTNGHKRTSADITLWGCSIFALWFFEDLFFVIQRSYSANEAFRGKTRCLSVLSEGSSVLWTTESEGSRKHTRGCTRDSSLHFVPFWMTIKQKNLLKFRKCETMEIRGVKRSYRLFEPRR